MPKQKERYSYLDEWKSLWEPHLEAIAYNGATCDPTRVDHKVLEWVQHHCSHQPHFIKIINTGAVHGGPGLKLNTKCQLVSHSFHTSNLNSVNFFASIHEKLVGYEAC